jgi:hypothetical protein
VEILDVYFGNVCELDLVFNFYKVCLYFVIGIDLDSVIFCWMKCLWQERLWKRGKKAMDVSKFFYSKPIVLGRMEQMDLLQ